VWITTAVLEQVFGIRALTDGGNRPRCLPGDSSLRVAAKFEKGVLTDDAHDA
jgi:hypothetical protein